MTSRERVRRALARQETDRVPIDYDANADIDRRVKMHYGLTAGDDEGLRQRLGVDIRHVAAPYRGPRLYADLPERGIKVDEWGIHRRWVEHDSGGYWDYCDFPLREANADEVMAWAMPSPDDHDYSGVAAQCRQLGEYGVHVGGGGLGCVINTAGFFRGMEQVFLDLITDDPAGLLLIDRFLDIQYEVIRRTIEAAEGGFDFMWIGEDLGSQRSAIIGTEVFRRHIRPRHQRFLDLAAAHDLPVMLHTCGSSSWAYPDYIAMGLAAVDTLQPEAKDMSPAYLKSTFGDRLAFRGCISTAGPVAWGTVEDVKDYCRQTLATMMPGGGYIFAPTHSLQDNSPTANVVAMYETAHRDGVFK